MNSRSLVFLTASALLFPAATPARAADLYVSPDGNDAWSGRAPAPGAAGEGPVATLARARDLARALKKETAAPRPLTIEIRGGLYPLPEPFLLAPEDSGEPGAPIVYAARPGETPVFSGGKRITGWKQGTGPLWQVEIPEVKAGAWYFHQLFVNGARRTRARTPNEGYLRARGPLETYSKDRKNPDFSKASIRLGFKFRQGDLQPSWRNLGDVNLFLYHSWTTSMNWIDRIEEDPGTVHFTNRSGWPVGYWETGQRYHVENVREALDVPGEWYLDRKTGLLEYCPLPGEDLSKAEVMAPRLQQLLRVEGDWAGGNTVHDVALRGLSFQHSDWGYTSKTQVFDGQAFVFLPGALQARGTERLVLEDCEIAHTGTYAVALEEGCKENRLLRCHIHDFGGGGVRIGEFTRQKTASRTADVQGAAVPELTAEGTGRRDTSRNTVDNCFIHEGGRVFAAGVGVIIGHSACNEVTRNEICDLFYSSISVGWVWGFGESAAHHNRIADNHLHHIGWGVLSDMGGVYTLGPSPGTVITHNHIHHVNCYSYGGWGLYTDEGSSGIVLENNLVHDTRDGGFHQHYGRDNIVRNNILAFSRETQIRRSREDVPNNITVERNIAYCDNDNILSKIWKNGDYAVNRNLYWTTAKAEPLFDARDWDEWRATSGQDKDSLVADPLFADAAARDFRLQPGSPAEKTGFQPFPLTGFGLCGDEAWVALPRKIARPEFHLPPTAPPALAAFCEDFESTAAGEKTSRAETQGEDGGASIRVSGTCAASGKQSLQFTDAAGLKAAHFPLLQYRPRLIKGTARARFQLRPEPGAIIWHEWRDAGKPYHAGPSVRVEANGDVTAGGKKIASLPSGQWARFEIVCALGEGSTGTWSLTVTPAGGPPVTQAELPLRSKEFKRLQWFGFISMAENQTTFHLDDLQLESLSPAP